MESYQVYKEAIESSLSLLKINQQPVSLYEPYRYFLSLGGKRLRPALLLMAVDGYKGDWKKYIPQALAMEIFHNFSLVHDDIMDQSEQRRGKSTIHIRNGLPVAILLGDVMLVNAYEMLVENMEGEAAKLMKIFSSMAVEVCEGQQKDMDFEIQTTVTKADYLDMIRQKTAVLLGACLEIGALCANADFSHQKNTYQFGIHAGMAFQLMDDYLDAFGTSAQTGKREGGDIYAAKKTWIYLHALEIAEAADKNKLEEIYKKTERTSGEVLEVLDIFRMYEIPEAVLALADDYSQKALQFLSHSGMHPEGVKAFEKLTKELLQRKA